MITTLNDPEGRPTVRQLLPPGPRLFPVGRLDADTSGLLLVTNDGELAHKLMHPRYGVEKRYRVLVDAVPESGQLARLRAGVTIEPGVRSGPADVRLARAHRDRPTLDVRIHEGRYRQVRRMCEAVGLGVKSLHRYGYGPLQLGPLPRGAARPLSPDEVKRLRAVAARPGGSAPLGRRTPPGARRERFAARGARRERPVDRRERSAERGRRRSAPAGPGSWSRGNRRSQTTRGTRPGPPRSAGRDGFARPMGGGRRSSKMGQSADRAGSRPSRRGSRPPRRRSPRRRG